MNRDESITYAKQYLENILSFFGLNTDVAVSCDEDVIELNVPSTQFNGFLIGQRGDTLRSLQQLISTTLKNRDAELTRVNLDVADYKRQRNERLSEQVQDWAKGVIETGEPMHLRPMSAAERRVVHQTLTDFSEVETHSEGEDRDRHVVLTRVQDSTES